MTAQLIQQLTSAGLVQFGSFQHGAEERPFLLDLKMLPSYPPVLDSIIQALAKHLPDSAPDYLVTPAQSVALAAGLSLRSQIPLVYSRGSGEAPVTDLVGAYDIGHPAVMIVDVLDNDAALAPLIQGMRRVGLNVAQVIAVIDTGMSSLEVDGLEDIRALLTLSEIAAHLREAGELPAGQQQAVQAWIEAISLRHRG